MAIVVKHTDPYEYRSTVKGPAPERDKPHEPFWGPGAPDAIGYLIGRAAVVMDSAVELMTRVMALLNAPKVVVAISRAAVRFALSCDAFSIFVGL